eukprot:g73071.t1
MHLLSSQERVGQLEAEVVSARPTLSKVERQGQQHTTTISQLQQQVQTLLKERDSLNEKCIQVEAWCSSNQGQEAKRLEMLLAETKINLAQAENDIEELQTENEELDDELSRTQKELAELRQDLKSARPSPKQSGEGRLLVSRAADENARPGKKTSTSTHTAAAATKYSPGAKIITPSSQRARSHRHMRKSSPRERNVARLMQGSTGR